MTSRIKKDDLVKFIAGPNKGKTAKVTAVLPKQNAALLEGFGNIHRHIKPSQFNPRGGSKEVHVAVPMHKLALVVDEKTGKSSRVGYVKSADGAKARVARQLKNKEIK